MTIKRTNGSDRDFATLVRQSDVFYRQTFGAAMDCYDQFNTIDTIEHAVVVYDDHVPVACGCFRLHDERTVEIKRMFVVPTSRNKGIAAEVLRELETWAQELGFRASILETSTSLIPAVNLYRKHGYERMENFGPYVGVEASICMQKLL
jgi:putative acetyltransferase